MAEFLITKGADVNAKDIQQHTPLHEAAAKSHKDIVEFLASN
jgi:ankyrin repeat protein